MIALLTVASSASAGELLRDFFNTINLPKLNITESDETPVISTLEAVGEETGKVVSEFGGLLEQLVSPTPTKQEDKPEATEKTEVKPETKIESKEESPKNEEAEKEAKPPTIKKRATPAPILSPAEFLKRQKEKAAPKAEK